MTEQRSSIIDWEQTISDFVAAGWARIGAASTEELRRVEETANRRYWSGPDRRERRILRAFGITHQQIALTPRSAFDGRHQQRQRNRRRRRR